MCLQYGIEEAAKHPVPEALRHSLTGSDRRPTAWLAVLRRCLAGLHLWGLVYRNFRGPEGRVRDLVLAHPL
jgi:hypothetical protein